MEKRRNEKIRKINLTASVKKKEIIFLLKLVCNKGKKELSRKRNIHKKERTLGDSSSSLT